MENQKFDMSGVFPCEDLKSEMKAYFEQVKIDFEAENSHFSWDRGDYFEDKIGYRIVKILSYLFLLFNPQYCEWRSNLAMELFKYNNESISQYCQIRIDFLKFIIDKFDYLFIFDNDAVIMPAYNIMFAVSERDLIGELDDFPPEIVQRMLECQYEQTGKVSIKELQEIGAAKGFDWRNTLEGASFWISIVYYRMFDLFFSRYPKAKTNK